MDDKQRDPVSASAANRDGQREAAVSAPKPKQAVIVVHGMGEQRPMATLRDFVDSVADSDDVYIVPDQSTGSAELARIKVPAGKTGRIGTDFYEFYYADLLGGGTFAQLRGWVLGLMVRWPHQVPRDVARIWAFMWAITLLTLAWLGPLLKSNPVTAFSDLLANRGVSYGNPSVTQTIMLALVCLFLSIRLSMMAHAHVSSQRTAPNPIRTLSPNISYLMAIAVPAGMFAAAHFAFPWKSFAWPSQDWCTTSAVIACTTEFLGILIGQTWFKLLAAVIVWYLLTGFGVAYFGDVARYVGVSPQSIEGRRAIRERGLKLLDELHKRRAFSGGQESALPEYQRIIIVAHSLGSIVAYDVMRIFWAQRNLCSMAKIPEPALNALKEMAALPGRETLFDDAQLNTLTGLQDAVALSVRDKPENWRITDFITLGSPLARADFLMSRDWPRFLSNIVERQFPTCPPVLERSGFTYDNQKAGGQVPHHAAMFAATRWLAIFDPVRGLLFGGDFIGGPVRKMFGGGISQLAIRITRKGWLFPSVFTHTDYWRTDVQTAIDRKETHLPSDLATAFSHGQAVINVLRRRIWPSG